MYRESREKQMSKKKRGMAAFQNEEGSYSRREPMQKEHTLETEAKQHGSIQVLAHQIYQEKGGGALENWLEAEQIFLRKEHYK